VNVVSATAILLVMSDPSAGARSALTPVRRTPAEVTTFGRVTAGSIPPGRPGPAGPQRRAPAPLPSRRAILRTGALGGAIASLAAAGCSAARTATAGAGLTRTYDFNQGWLFGGGYVDGSADPRYDDSGFAEVTLPHTVTPLSWGSWDPASWQGVWIYRKHFGRPERRGARVLVTFDGVLVNATVLLNGTTLGAHQGGYLPWSAELTGHLAADDNVLAVIVDSRWLPVPPEGAPGGPAAVDYLQPGGIYRDVTLRVVPEVFLSDVFAQPADVLGPGRRVHVQATIDAAAVPRGPVRVAAELRDGSRALAGASARVTITRPGTTLVRLGITGIGDVTLWSPRTPKLYTVRVTLAPAGRRTPSISGPGSARRCSGRTASTSTASG